MRIKRDVQKGKERKKKKMMRSVHLLSPELSCVCLTRTTREEKHGYNPRQTSVKTRTAQKKPERMKLFVPSGYLHSAALRPPAGVAK